MDTIDKPDIYAKKQLEPGPVLSAADLGFVNFKLRQTQSEAPMTCLQQVNPRLGVSRYVAWETHYDFWVPYSNKGSQAHPIKGSGSCVF